MVPSGVAVSLDVEEETPVAEIECAAEKGAEASSEEPAVEAVEEDAGDAEESENKE